jgi:hypothetical protein
MEFGRPAKIVLSLGNLSVAVNGPAMPTCAGMTAEEIAHQPN